MKETDYKNKYFFNTCNNKLFKMKKTELIKLTMFSIILSISLIITSCEQVPVTPPEEQSYQFDSARFQWQNILLPKALYSIIQYKIKK